MRRSRCDWCARYAESVGFDYDAQAKICDGCRVGYTDLVGRFTPWIDVGDATPEQPWVLDGYIARHSITLLAGKPKAGKSTFACAIAEAVDAEAETFVGRHLDGGAVVYVSEEGSGTLAPKLGQSVRSRALTRDNAWPKPIWPEVIAGSVITASEIGAVLLVIDSLSFWASFREGQEKDSGAAQATMDALTGAARDGLAVLLVHHQRKAGGGEGDAVRGSGAILGAVDLSIELERVGDDAPTQRRLVAVGRWPHTPPVLVVEREARTGAWRALGHAASREEAAAMGMRERILNVLTGAEGQITEDTLANLLDVDGRKVSRPLRDLVDEGRVTRSGEGKKGNPYTYSNAPPKSSPETRGESPLKCSPPPAGGEHQHLVPSPTAGEKGEKAGSADDTGSARVESEGDVQVEVWDFTSNGEVP
jgi:hypothetical protein